MSCDPHRHHRQSVRREDHDYRSSGIYYVTICAHVRECLFGSIREQRLCLSAWGEIVQEEWLRTASARHYVTLDAFVVMPNHLHGILFINVEATGTDVIQERERQEQTRLFGKPHCDSLASIMGAFKSAVTRRINIARQTPGAPLWQRNYYERIVRDERMLTNARRYIADNPSRWAHDVENPVNVTPA